jgi:hypothetical protein
MEAKDWEKVSNFDEFILFLGRKIFRKKYEIRRKQ